MVYDIDNENKEDNYVSESKNDSGTRRHRVASKRNNDRLRSRPLSAYDIDNVDDE